MSEEKKVETTEEVPSITKIIDGVPYTVRIHFSTSTKETVQDKVKRLIRNEIISDLNAAGF